MWGRFFIPVLALFYIASQVNLEQFTIIMAVFAFSTFILEIPTGVIADLLGKKKALLISRFLYVIEIILIAFFNGFWVFLIAKIISGIGVSFSSGTNQALLYDSLKKLNREEEHKKISGKANFISKISMAFVFIIGAYLFSINSKLPAIASLPLITLGFLLTFFIKEPYISKKKLNWKNSWLHLKRGLRYFTKNRYLKYFAAFTLVIGATISMILSLSSAYFEIIIIPIYLIGIISFVSNLLSAYTAKKAHFFEEKIQEKNSLFLILIITFISILGMSFAIPHYGLIFFLLIPFVAGFYEVILGDYVNRHAETSHRATMLSINNMFDNIGITILFPLLGYLTKSRNMQFSLFFFSLFLFLSGLLLMVFYKTKKNVNNKI